MAFYKYSIGDPIYYTSLTGTKLKGRVSRYSGQKKFGVRNYYIRLSSGAELFVHEEDIEIDKKWLRNLNIKRLLNEL